MAHGGYGKRRVAERGPPVSKKTRGLGVEKKTKPASLKNQIRSIERFLQRKNLPLEVKKAQEKKLEELKKQTDIHARLAIERKMSLRYRKIKFFERRKIERRIRRLEKLQRTSSNRISQEQIAHQLSNLREDLEYVRFFPKTEKYVSLFIGGDDEDLTDKRNKLRKQIKASLMAAAARGKDLEETGSDDDGPLDMSEDDFFLSGSSSDEADADDEWTDRSMREQASSTSGKAASGMSSDEKNQRQISARALMPPPRSLANSPANAFGGQTRFAQPSKKNLSIEKVEFSTSSYTSRTRSGPSSNKHESSKTRTGHSSNLSSNSDARKPRRKRRPKKKKQA